MRDPPPGIPANPERQPAYKLDFSGRAIACWANKSNSAAYVQVEDESSEHGSKKVFSGCEFMSGRDREQLQVLARGSGWRDDLRRGPSSSIDRAPFKQIEFPSEVTIKKIDGQGSPVSLALDTDGNMWAWG